MDGGAHNPILMTLRPPILMTLRPPHPGFDLAWSPSPNHASQQTAHKGPGPGPGQGRAQAPKGMLFAGLHGLGMMTMPNQTLGAGALKS